MQLISMDGVIRIISIATMVFFIALTLFQAVRYFRTALGVSQFTVPECSEGGGGLRTAEIWTGVALAFVLSRMVLLIVTAVYAYCGGNWDTYKSLFTEYLSRWDGNHYLGLMKNWYVTEGDPRFHLVFFPLYPLMGRGLVLLGLSARAAALILSNAALIGCGGVTALLVRDAYGAKYARRALWLLFFCPVSFFFSMTYTESVFLLMTLLAVWFARKRRFGWAVFFGALAANARMLGMATAIPIFWEMLHAAWERYVCETGESARRTDRAFLGEMGKCVLRVLPVSLGLIAYLLLNYQLHGNAFQFLIYQKEHWYQQIGSLAYTIQYTLKNALNYHSVEYRYGTWIPQIVTIFGSIILMTATFRRQHPGDAAYALVYFYFAIAPTWLLSGARYVAAMYALYPMLAVLLKRRWAFGVMLVVEIVLMGYMAVMGVNVGFVL